MSQLTMSTLSGLGARQFLKLTRYGARKVMRPDKGGLSGFLAGLGAAGSECGSAPQLQPGEQSQCCPNVGWVIYDSSESQYGLCEKARALTPSATPPSSGTTSSDPMARVEEMRRKIDERRDRADEERFQRRKQEMQLRFVMGQMSSVQAQEAARVKAKLEREAAERRAKAKARAEKARRERNKKLLIGGAVAVIAWRLVGALKR